MRRRIFWGDPFWHHRDPFFHHRDPFFWGHRDPFFWGGGYYPPVYHDPWFGGEVKMPKYTLKIYWPEGMEEIKDVKKVDLDEGGMAQWRDPESNLRREVSGVPVCLEEQPDED